jgi:hypothetical protein
MVRLSLASLTPLRTIKGKGNAQTDFGSLGFAFALTGL